MLELGLEGKLGARFLFRPVNHEGSAAKSGIAPLTGGELHLAWRRIVAHVE